MSKRRAGKYGKERRAARRKRDSDWVKLKAVQLILIGASRDIVHSAMAFHKTRGHFAQWMARTGWSKALSLHAEGKYPP